jgi:hypothetical protein
VGAGLSGVLEQALNTLNAQMAVQVSNAEEIRLTLKLLQLILKHLWLAQDRPPKHSIWLQPIGGILHCQPAESKRLNTL